MRKLGLLTAVALIGGTAVACSYDSRTYDPGYTTTQYVMAPGYTATTQYVVTSGSPYSRSADWDRDGVPDWRDRRPNNPYRY